MNIAGMQPYLFPYIGYFQIINCSDRFVLADNLQYINQGWINRNRILVQNKIHMITAPIKKDKAHLKINERHFSTEFNEKSKKKFLKTLYHAYREAPNFKTTFELIEFIIMYQNSNVAAFTANSIKEICAFLDIKAALMLQSELELPATLNAEDSIIHICKKLSAKRCINAIGGRELYSPEKFRANGIKLEFIKTRESLRYAQFNDEFVPNLSIIDVMMFNSKNELLELLEEYDLVEE
jgi:hypothetical protein